MTAQAPLPVLPAQAVQVGDVAGLVQDETGGQVYVRGEVIFAWGPGDEACRRLVAVQLVELEIAATRPVAAAFGVSDQTIWRWRTAYAGQGVGSLVGEKKGPKRASKLTQDVVADIIAGKAAGGSNRAVAAAVGVSEGSVRTVMAAHQGGQDSDEVDGSPREQAETAGHVEPAPARDPQEQKPVLPVLADPVPRWGERALARAGLLGQAAPVFTAAARVPLAGLLLALPGLERTGLLDCAKRVYGALPSGFYGLDTVLTEAVFQTLAGQPRAEGAARIDPA